MPYCRTSSNVTSLGFSFQYGHSHDHQDLVQPSIVCRRQSMELNSPNCARTASSQPLELSCDAALSTCNMASFARGCGTPPHCAFRYALPHRDLRHAQRAPSVQNSLDPERRDHFALRSAKHRAIRPQLFDSPQLPIIERFRTDPAANPSPPPVSSQIPGYRASIIPSRPPTSDLRPLLWPL
jgi:hypothetical protein